MGILKFRLNRKNSSGSYDTIHYESSSNIILRPDSTTVENSLISLETLTASHTSSISSHSSSISSLNSSISNLNSEMSSLKTSVSNGKAQIASAITGKGVSTSSSASFSTMASNISRIKTPSAIDEAWMATMDDYYWMPEIGLAWRDITYSISPDPYIAGRANITNDGLNLETSVINGPYSRIQVKYGNYYPLCNVRVVAPTSRGTAWLSSGIALEVSDGYNYGSIDCRISSASVNNSNKTISVRCYIYSYQGTRVTETSYATITLNYSAASMPISYWTREPASGNDEYKVGSMLVNMRDYNYSTTVV